MIQEGKPSLSPEVRKTILIALFLEFIFILFVTGLANAETKLYKCTTGAYYFTKGACPEPYRCEVGVNFYSDNIPCACPGGAPLAPLPIPNSTTTSTIVTSSTTSTTLMPRCEFMDCMGYVKYLQNHCSKWKKGTVLY